MGKQIDELTMVPTTLTEWALKLRGRHTCGGAVWITNLRQQTVFYEEIGYSDYIAVDTCPHCHGALAPASVGVNR